MTDRAPERRGRGPSVFEQLFEDADVLIAVFDGEGICRLINRKTAGLLGGAPTDFVGRTFPQLHQGLGVAYAQRICTVVDSGQSMDFEDLVDFPTGRCWVLSRVSPVLDAGGAPWAGQIIGFDYSERDQAELRLKNLVAIGEMKPRSLSVVDNERVLRMLIDHAPAALAIFDQEMRCLAASQRWLQDYGGYVGAGHRPLPL